jgi:hypothetical protein
MNKTPKSGGGATAFWRGAAKPHQTFFCCNLNLGRAENGIEMPALPIESVVECAFSFHFMKDWLEVPFEGFGLGDDLSAATASAERGAKVASCFMRAIRVFVG